MKFGSGQIDFPDADQVGGEVGSGRGGVRLQANCLLEMRIGFRVLRLRGIDHAEEFVDVEALGNLAQKAFELLGSFGEVAGVVIREGGLKLLG